MFSQHKEGVLISLHIVPNASKTEIIGAYDKFLKVKIKAPPVDGKANQEIIDFFRSVLDCGKKEIELVSGDKSKQKILLIRGRSLEELKTRLLQKNS